MSRATVAQTRLILDLRFAPQEEMYVRYHKSQQERIFREIIYHWFEPTTTILLNGHRVKLFYKFTPPYS